MALPSEELEAITNDYFMADGGNATDIFFKTSFLLNYLMKQQKGIWERPPGGEKIRVPLEYSGQVAGFYGRGDTLSSDDRESVNAAYFDWKHSYGNATIYRIDQLKNNDRYAEVQLVTQRVSGAQKSLTDVLASSIYDLPTGDSKRLTGLRACCNETTTISYGGIAEGDMVASDGTKPWEGKMNTSITTISLANLRTLLSAAKVRDGKGGSPDIVVTTEAIFNILKDIIQIQQRFTDNSEAAKVGFKGISFEGVEIFPDDYCPANHLFCLNTEHIGFAIHQDGYFMRTKWEKISDSPEDKAMKIYWDGNLVVNNRKAHQGASSITG